MEAAAVTPPKRTPSEHLLEHCFAHSAERPSARDRLEALLGSELARRLVLALSTVR
jgi:hypothetical protein